MQSVGQLMLCRILRQKSRDWRGQRWRRGRRRGTYFRIIRCEFQCGTKWDQLDPPVDDEVKMIRLADSIHQERGNDEDLAQGMYDSTFELELE